MPRLLLRCRITPGMFSNERVATFVNDSGQGCSMFVPLSCVAGDSHIEVEEGSRHEGRVLIWLPAPMLNGAGGGNTVTVMEQQLVRERETVYDD